MNSITTTISGSKVRKKNAGKTLAGKIIHRILSRLKNGRIVISDGGHRCSFGDGEDLCAHIRVLDRRFYSRVLTGGSIGAAEAYVHKLWETDDLTAIVRLMARNMSVLDTIENRFGWLLLPFRFISHKLKRNSKSGARRNILAHYDLGNDMYQTFLDSRMMYSSAIYPTAGADLETASEYKLETICRKLNLKATDKVLEIGSGWCGFAIYAARRYGCHITTTTISDAQYREGRKRIARAGLQNRITLLKRDYRDLSGTFDKLVSIEMVEAVGHEFHPTFFKTCGRLLKDNGRMVLQAITINDQSYQKYRRGVDFIQKYIFPGGCLLSNSRMLELIAKQTDMVVRNLDDFGPDYARTLRDWRQRFNNAFSSLKEAGYDERFRRLWNFYLCYCEGGFTERTISVVQLVAEKPRALG